MKLAEPGETLTLALVVAKKEDGVNLVTRGVVDSDFEWDLMFRYSDEEMFAVINGVHDLFQRVFSKIIARRKLDQALTRAIEGDDHE